MSQKRYSIPPLLMAPIARIGTDYIQPLFTAAIINKLGQSTSTSMSDYVWPIIGFFAVPFFSELLWRYMLWSVNYNDSLGMEKIANRTFADLIGRSYDFHINNFAGALVAKTGRFINAYEPLYDTLVMDIAGTFVGLIFAVVVLLKISRPSGIAVLIVFAIFAFVVTKLTRKKFRLNKIRAEKESLQTAQLADSLTNAISVKTFAKEIYEEKLFRDITKEVRIRRRRAWDYQNMPMDLITTNTVITLNTIALIAGILAVRHGIAQVGTLVVILLYVRSLTRNFWDMSRIMRTVENNLSNAVEMMNILDKDAEVLDKIDAKSLKVKSGNIRFTSVGFTYGDEKQKSRLFEDFSLEIPSGQTVGLVGPSGGGKTTITKLLLRFMDVRDGSIKIDGQDISEVTQRSLRDAITYVPQEPLLFHRSLKENIAYGKPTATMKEIIEAAKKAHAHEFIENLKDGYDTLVGERGVKLSGGQRQRVAIARAILKNSPIVVLDEATSALDSESEQLIQQALFTLMEGRTTLVIAHRLSTIKHLDRILVLENGKVTEDGSHEELIAMKNGTYARLWSHQSGGFIE
ncbi:ABC transporter ATP-binding protein [Candidatus Saccharibacteria bacterium]|nr:ABC transporter ATP-binding protein [Candidatus Saccharibacteria bacterium]